MADKDKTSELPGSKNLGNLKMIWAYAVRYPKQISLALFFLLIASAATSAIPVGFKYVVDKGFSEGGDIDFWFAILFSIVVVLAIATASRFYFVSWLGERVIADVRAAVVQNLVRMSPSYFDENRPSEIASRLTSDTTVIEQIVGTTASVALRNFLTGILGTAIMLWLAPKLALSILIGIPIVVLPIVFFGRRLQKLSRHTQDRVADVGVIVNEVLGAMKIVQAFNQEAREANRFSSAVENTFATARRRIRIRAFMTATVILLIFGSISLVVREGALDVQAGTMTGGTIAAFVLMGGLVAGAFGSLTEVYGDLVRGAGAASRLSELLAEQPGIAAPPNPRRLPSPALGHVMFDKVSFRYPSRPDASALDGLSLDIQPGETVAVVGPSGAGKSTLFQLIQRFYDPSGGTVRIDGIALPDADPAEIRSRIAMVPQETVIFAASARDNLRYGKWEADDDALWAAARAANAAEFLEKLPDGLDTFMGEGGARLSGGQRQRLAIARAILRDAPILLLDEATSALDAESERLVQDALDKLMAGRTTIVIAHRLATVRAADRIVVMDEGRIVEQGNHESLTRAGGLYARLARMQFEGLAA
jgi:ATP-binding cassette, subfamily B, bacterial